MFSCLMEKYKELFPEDQSNFMYMNVVIAEKLG